MLGCYLLLPAYYRKFQANFEETLTEISWVVKKIMDDIAYNIGFKFWLSARYELLRS